ncbi:MAG: phage major capsid domain-containing protein, partial [Candidatus Fonsibacter sp.]
MYVKFEVNELLLLSPFIFGSGYGKQGFYSIQAISLAMVMNGATQTERGKSCRAGNVKQTTTVV